MKLVAYVYPCLHILHVHAHVYAPADLCPDMHTCMHLLYIPLALTLSYLNTSDVSFD